MRVPVCLLSLVDHLEPLPALDLDLEPHLVRLLRRLPVLEDLCRGADAFGEEIVGFGTGIGGEEGLVSFFNDKRLLPT